MKKIPLRKKVTKKSHVAKYKNLIVKKIRVAKSKISKKNPVVQIKNPAVLFIPLRKSKNLNKKLPLPVSLIPLPLHSPILFHNLDNLPPILLDFLVAKPAD